MQDHQNFHKINGKIKLVDLHNQSIFLSIRSSHALGGIKSWRLISAETLKTMSSEPMFPKSNEEHEHGTCSILGMHS